MSSMPTPDGVKPPARWPKDELAERLVSTDPAIRLDALANAVLPESAAPQCIAQLVRCCNLSDQAEAQCLCAVALGGLAPEVAGDDVSAALTNLVQPGHAIMVRIFAAHALFRLKRLPVEAAPHIATLLTHDDNAARKTALLALEPFAAACAHAIVAVVTSTPPSNWTAELLAAFAASAGNDTAAKSKVEEFMLRAMRDLPIAAAVAAFAAMARLNPGGNALGALLRMASALEREKALPAIAALGSLGVGARTAAAELARMLTNTSDPEIEEALCRALVQIRAEAGQLPLRRAIERIESAPDRAAAAYCMLLTLHPQQTRAAADTLLARARDCSDALRGVIASAFKTLTGTELPPQAIGN